MQTIRELLSRNLERPIEEVIKVSQQDEQTVHEEILEYVATDRIKQQYIDVLRPIADAPSEPTEGVGVWVSGFFGSGKSSFAKILGYILANREVLDEQASDLFLKQLWGQVQQTPTKDDDKLVEKIENHLKFINARYPSHVIMFDVQVDRAVRRSTEPIAEVMYTVLLRELDYSEDYDVAALEIELEQEGQLAKFVQAVAKLNRNTVKKATDADAIPPTLAGVSVEDYGIWQQVRKGAQRINRASAALHEIDPRTYPAADSWATSLSNKDADIKIRDLVDRTFTLAALRKPGHGIVFIIDEVGAYVARSAEKIENLRAVVEQFGQESKNRVSRRQAVAPVWVIVTSQEKLDEVVAAIDDKRVELAKMQDRFPIRIDMAPADIREVATRRVLAKTRPAEAVLAERYRAAAAQLGTHTRLERTSRAFKFDENNFIQHYPYLPHFIDLSIDIVTGMRQNPGAPRHISGSNRTIIKQAYEMLVSDRTKLADKPVGTLVTLDRIYDLVEGNLPSEKQKDIGDIGTRWPNDPWPTRIAKAIGLLEYVRDLPRTPANIAALLYDRLGADSPLEQVTQSLALLEHHQFVRQAEDGWKLLTAQEKSWTAERNAFNPNPREVNDLLEESLRDIFTAANFSRYRNAQGRTFRVGATWENRRLTTGDSQIPLSLVIADGSDEFEAVAGEARDNSRANKNQIYWVASLTTEIDEIVAELYRSQQMVGKYNQLRAQGKITKEESASLSDEKTAVLRQQERLKGRLETALAGGRGYFDGVEKTGAALGKTLPDIYKALFDYAVPLLYPKLEMGTRALRGGEAEEILRAANLNGLSSVFYAPPAGLDLVVPEGSKYVVNNAAQILHEVADYLNREHSYGNKVTGKLLEAHFGGLGYGWELEMLQLVLATLLRGGGLEVTYQGRRYRNHLDPQVRLPFAGTNAFRAASFAPRRAIDLQTLVKAAQRYEQLTGDEVDVEETVIAQAFQALVRKELEMLLPVEATARAHNIPVMDILQEYRTTLDTVLNSLSDDAVSMLAGEGASFQAQREEVRRIRKVTDTKGLERLRRVRRAVTQIIGTLKDEFGDEAFTEEEEALKQYLSTGGIEQLLTATDSLLKRLEQTYREVYSNRHEERTRAFGQAIAEIRKLPDWPILSGDQGDDDKNEISPEKKESLIERKQRVTLAYLVEPLSKRNHDLEILESGMTCEICGSSLAEMNSDLLAVEALKQRAIQGIRELTSSSENVTRVHISDFVNTGHTLNTRDEIDALIEELRVHLYKLIDAETKIILE